MKYFKYGICILALVASMAGGFFIGVNFNRQATADKYLTNLSPIRQTDANHPLIHPLLAYHIPSASDQQSFRDLQNSINRLVDKKKSGGEITSFSIFVKELETGRWIGIDEYREYPPASLMKVALMVAHFKKSEQDKDLLNRKLLFSKEFYNFTYPKPYAVSTKLEVDASYSVQELINRMIIDSDNGAMTLLMANIESTYLESVFKDLGIHSPTEGAYVISPLDYSLFFRILYNATYLNKDMSEKALRLLTQTTFVDGLVAGVPEGTAVAHKFGENITLDNAKKITAFELYDCGIVYYKPSPYFLCIMTEGPQKDSLQHTIRDVSKLIYEEIAKKAGG